MRSQRESGNPDFHVEAAKSRIVSLRGDIRNCFWKNRTLWYRPEVNRLGVAGRGSRPMIDDDRLSRQLIRSRAARRERGEPPRRLGARRCTRSSFPALTTRGSVGSGRSRLRCRRRLWINVGRGHGSSKMRGAAAMSRESGSARIAARATKAEIYRLANL